MPGDREASQRRWYSDSLTKKSLHPLFIGAHSGVSQMSLLGLQIKGPKQRERRGQAKVMQRWLTNQEMCT